MTAAAESTHKPGEAEAFVRRILCGMFGQEVDQATLKAVAAKVEKAVALPRRS